MRRARGKTKAEAGVTLVETLVYVVVSAIVLAVLTMTLRNMNKGFVTGTRTTRMQQGAREAVNIMTREIRNTGLKHAFYQSGGSLRDSLLTEASLLPGDSSSFSFAQRGRYDQISFRQARLDANGAPQGVDTVTYQVDSTRQMLRRKVNTGSFEDFCPGVDALQFQYGFYAQRVSTISERPPNSANWTRSGPPAMSFTPTRMVLALAAAGQGYVRNDAVTFSTAAARSYYVEITAAGDAGFFSDGGVLAAEIHSSGGSVLVSEPFLPGRSMTTRYLTLTAPASAGSRLAIRFKAAGAASVRIGTVKFGQADLGTYQWRDAPTLLEKKAVRAVRIMLMAKSQGQGAVKPSSTYLIGNATVNVVDTQLRRYFEEEVPISNNGVF
jgi:Tfp pilus assembly protein PilW